MEQMTADMRDQAQTWAKAHVHRVDSADKANELLKKKAGIVELPWCGSTECGHRLEERVNARMLGIALDCKEKVEGKCAVCGKKTQSLVRMAVAY
jgi:prolyl-tRNA synthetase